MKKHLFPFEVYRDEYWFAKSHWLLYKVFGIKRKIPCGRNKKTSFLCCCQPFDEEHCYLSDDKTEAYCKCCDTIKAMWSEPIDFNNIQEW